MSDKDKLKEVEVEATEKYHVRLSWWIDDPVATILYYTCIRVLLITPRVVGEIDVDEGE